VVLVLVVLILVFAPVLVVMQQVAVVALTVLESLFLIARFTLVHPTLQTRVSRGERDAQAAIVTRKAEQTRSQHLSLTQMRF
jgi:hypothetical protein